MSIICFLPNIHSCNTNSSRKSVVKLFMALTALTKDHVLVLIKKKVFLNVNANSFVCLGHHLEQTGAFFLYSRLPGPVWLWLPLSLCLWSVTLFY